MASSGIVRKPRERALGVEWESVLTISAVGSTAQENPDPSLTNSHSTHSFRPSWPTATAFLDIRTGGSPDPRLAFGHRLAKAGRQRMVLHFSRAANLCGKGFRGANRFRMSSFLTASVRMTNFQGNILGIFGALSASASTRPRTQWVFQSPTAKAMSSNWPATRQLGCGAKFLGVCLAIVG